MVIPPTYGDISKSAKELLNEGFNHGEVRIDWKNELQKVSELNLSGVHTNETGNLSGSTEIKTGKNGYNLLASWTTENRLTAEASCEDKLLNGLKLKAEGILEPHTADKSGKIELEFKRDGLRAVTDAKFLTHRPHLHSALTLAYRQFIFGGELSYDSEKAAFKDLGFGGSYEAHGVVLSATITDLKNLNACIYHRVSQRLETAAAVDWLVGQPQARISFGNKFLLSSSSFAKGTINSAGVVGVAYSKTLSDGIKATVSSEFNAKQLGAGGKHRFGVTLEFDSSAMRF